jgi:hypothetical protein
MFPGRLSPLLPLIHPMHTKRSCLAAFVLATTLLAVGRAGAQGTAFTYQGRLMSSGSSVPNGYYDLTFALYTASSGGSQVGSTITDAAQGVTNGLFSAVLDFGAVFNGTTYWLQIGVRSNGVGSYSPLAPREQLTPSPYSIFSGNSGVANQANSIAPGTVSPIQLNSLDSPSGGQVLAFNGSGLIWTNLASVSLGWSLTGNAGITPGVNFLGTTDNEPLELWTYGDRALRLSFAERNLSSGILLLGWDDTVNVVGGYWGNYTTNGAIGATIAGGGFIYYPPFIGGASTPYPNAVTNDFGTVGGGADNTSGGFYGTVPGGYLNRAFGDYSLAAGRRAVSTQAGSLVWADDSVDADFVSTLPNEVAIRAVNGMYMATQSGVRMDAQDRPIITRGWDPFLATAPNGKQYCGRWGLFMEPGSLTLGIPAADVGYRQMEVARYYTDGSRDTLFYVGNDGITRVKVLTILGGADVAEPFAMSQEQIAKGSVVVIDEKHPGKLKLASRAYDTRVAGIVSGANGVNSGLSLQQDGVNAGGQNVALTGRVYALADTCNGAIEPGDLLTTSDRPGYAMKVTDHARAQGAILGKAMTGLSEGSGTVLVLVTLQ